MDSQCAHHHGRHRLRRALPRLGDGTARLGRRAGHPDAVRRNHLLHLRPPRRLLPHRRSAHREEKLHLHGRRRILLESLAGVGLWRFPVRQLGRDCNRVHDHSVHQRGCYQQGQLLPQERPGGRLRRVRLHVHGGVRGRPDLLLPGPQLPRPVVALHPRRRHVLHLRLHRRRPLPGADHIGSDRQVHPDRHRGWSGRRFRPEDLARIPGARRHRLRLLLLHDPHRDPGHGEVSAGGEQDDEEGDAGGSVHHDGLLHAVRLPRLRGVRQRRQGEHPHRLRLLRALLAHRLRQRLHRRAPGRRIPGVLPAHLRRRGELRRRDLAQRRVHHPGAPRRRRQAARVQPQPLQADVEDGVRDGEHAARHPHALLQRHPRLPGRHRVLAAHRLLPRGDVHPAAGDTEVHDEVGGAADAQLPLLPGVARRGGGVHRGRHGVAQELRPVQDQVVRMGVFASCGIIGRQQCLFLFMCDDEKPSSAGCVGGGFIPCYAGLCCSETQGRERFIDHPILQAADVGPR
ncbi:uncharacterized protein LOC123412133 isoform X1 [Hordeum vulgare subsp. vulgare]|uniref:uncharacterized protein LOC123412133 isoform X1 n=1 Tax=Hordeum vulgare subsp. vulgare TaxID=112509 RepID=UPI001D1A4B38|nr:uncharacterized protein LOC123412133 isoform X1 [Hordeum vulgare subsp. vulgare]